MADRVEFISKLMAVYPGVNTVDKKCSFNKEYYDYCSNVPCQNCPLFNQDNLDSAINTLEN